MPRGHGKKFVNTDKVIDRRSWALSKRFSEQCNRKFPSKESQMVVPILRNCEDRRVVLTFLTLDDHMWRLLVPFTSFIQGPELRNQPGSLDSVNADMLDGLDSSKRQPSIFIQFDLKEQNLCLPENPAFSSGSVKTITEYRPPASNVLPKPHKLRRNNFNLPGAIASEEASRHGYTSDWINLNTSVDVSSKVNKPSKPNSRNKGKKKRKHYKRSIHKKTSTKPENQSEEVKCDASESETSASGDAVYLNASGISLSLVDTQTSLIVHDASTVVMEQLDIENNGKDCSGKLSNSVGEQLDSRNPPYQPYVYTDNTNKLSIVELVASQDSLHNCETRFSATNDNIEYSCLENDLSSGCSVSGSHWQKDVIETDSSTERFLESSQASSSDDFLPVIRAKRGRLARKLSGISNGMHRLNSFHLRRYSENDNKFSKWQKVEKPRTSEVTYPKSNDKLASRDADVSVNCMKSEVRSEQVTELKQSSSVKSFRSTCTYLEKLRKNPCLDATETQSASHTTINSINAAPKIQVLRKDNVGTLAEFTKISDVTDCTNSSLRKTKNSQSNFLQQATVAVTTCSTLHCKSSFSLEMPPISSEIKKNHNLSFADTEPHSNIVHSTDISKQTSCCPRNEGLQPTRLEIERTNNSFTSQLQMCLPSPIITKSQIVSQEESIMSDPVTQGLISSFTDELLTSNSHGFDSSEMQCLICAPGSMDCSSCKEDELTRKLNSQPCTSSRESHDFPSPSGCHFSGETGNKQSPCFETDFSKITEAVDGSYKLFVAAEGIHRANGGPLAEFEKVLSCASPLIESGSFNMCATCSQNQSISNSSSSFLVPNISLKNLWQWYEKPGSYGLEVKVNDFHTTNRSRNGLLKYCAYFVPYLSAVQLFARPARSISYPNNDTEGYLKTCEVCKTCKSLTSLASLPIFAKLLPRPQRKADTPSENLVLSDSCEEFGKPVFSKQLADELLFEYFDSDQPQQRRPLFDKVQELIRGDSLSNCDFFGDPSKLGCLNLKELHPASWYAVAWYPIYRIPDGNFRAAFLTYHSFGHFVSRSTSSITEGCINTVISPVVGLQSYNAKGECWFVPKNLNSSEEASEILKGRLQSLERTANAMSRATIRKGNLECTNRHPDYEFFLSRSR